MGQNENFCTVGVVHQIIPTVHWYLNNFSSVYSSGTFSKTIRLNKSKVGLPGKSDQFSKFFSELGTRKIPFLTKVADKHLYVMKTNPCMLIIGEVANR